MPDLLAHALIAYSLCRLLSWRYDWITTPYVTAGMAGAFIPDIAKAGLLVTNWQMRHLLGVPFDWFALHTGGGVLVSILIGGVIVVPQVRTRALAILSVGAVSHLLADALLLTPTGYSYPILWPLTRYRPPTPGLYLSTEPEPMLVAGVVASGVYIGTRYRNRSRTDT